MSTAQILEENARIEAEIRALLDRNTKLQREMMQLNTQREICVSEGHKQAAALTQELKELDQEVEQVEAECKQMIKFICGSDSLRDEDDQMDVEPYLNEEDDPEFESDRENRSFLSNALERPKPQLPSRDKLMLSITSQLQKGAKHASMVRALMAKKDEHGVRRPPPHQPPMPSPSPASLVLDYKNSFFRSNSNSSTGSSSSSSHLENFRRHSGPYRKNKDTVVL